MMTRFRTPLMAVLGALLAGCAITPKEIPQNEINQIIEKDREKLYANQAPIQKDMGLGEVLARAIRYNLQYRTDQLTQAVAKGQFEMARYDMLPTLAAEAGFVSRSNVSASRSVSIFTNNETLEPSTSQDKDREIAQLKFSWNILDFGVSYFEAKQNADKAIIADNARQKALNSIMQKTYTAYWNALNAQELGPKVEKALKDGKKAINNIEQGLKAQAYGSPVDALKLQKQLHQSVKELDLIADSLAQSQTLLRNLINAPSNQQITLLPFTEKDTFKLESVPMATLELTAIANSLDMKDRIYSARIERLETRKAMARLLPGIEVSYNSHYDSNSFAYHDHWGEFGLQVSFNLMKLASTRETLKNADLREAVEEQKRLALSMAVVTQFQIALNRLNAANKQFYYAELLKNIGNKISNISKQQSARSKSLVESVQDQVASLQAYMGYASMKTSVRDAKGAVFFSMGLSPVPKNHQRMNLNTLAESIENRLTDWYAGDFERYSSDSDRSEGESITLR